MSTSCLSFLIFFVSFSKTCLPPQFSLFPYPPTLFSFFLFPLVLHPCNFSSVPFINLSFLRVNFLHCSRASGVSEQNLELPDTITKWVGKAVCAHPEKGVGLSERTSITTFTPFFSDLTLPPSVKRGEVLPVKISVFNYLDQPLPVSSKAVQVKRCDA